MIAGEFLNMWKQHYKIYYFLFLFLLLKMYE